MSTITPDAESFVIINQAGPHSNQAKITEGQKLPPGLTNVPEPIVMFYKGQPEALGATQIFVGVLFFVFGICITTTCDYICSFIYIVVYSGMLFWTAIAYIIAGSLSVAASVKPTLGKISTAHDPLRPPWNVQIFERERVAETQVRSSLVVNIISSIFGAAAIILVAITFIFYYSYHYDFCIHYTWKSGCEGAFNLWVFSKGILALLLLFITLIFCISISLAVFGCRTVCKTSFQEVTVVLYQTAPPTTDTSDTKDLSPVAGSPDGNCEIQEAVKH